MLRTDHFTLEEKKAAFVGGGMIGSALAVNAAAHGFTAVIWTRRQLGLCKERVERILEFFKGKELLTIQEAEALKKRITYTTQIREAAENAVFIQESVPENLEIKQEIISAVEKYAPVDAIIASSASSLSITRIFEKAIHPERCMGGHPYHPAYLLPLIEITKGEKTEDSFLLKAKEVYAAWGKVPVILKKESIGFIANRLQSAVHREIIDLVMNGVCSVEDVDKALVYSVGVRWGVIGQAMTLHLGAAPEGLSGFCKKHGIQDGVPDARFSALANWNIYPKGWDQLFGAGIQEAMEHREPETGNDMETVEKWRDSMLVEILKLHNKL